MARKKAVKSSVKKRLAAKKPAKKKVTKPVRKKDGRPAIWWPALSPYMTVRDGQASLEFYARAFGFETFGEVMRDKDGLVQHGGMRLGDAAIMFAPAGMSSDMQPPSVSGAGDSLSLYVYVPDVDALTARARRAGAKVLQEPADQFWGDRIAIFKDPDGYHWTFATNVGGFDANKAPH